jgi:hypothetical protein
MKSYNARLEKTTDLRFNEFPIVLKTGVPVHKNTKLSWIEEIDEDADSSEREWYNHVVKHNVKVYE